MGILWVGSLDLKSEQGEMALGVFQLGWGWVVENSLDSSEVMKEGTIYWRATVKLLWAYVL